MKNAYYIQIFVLALIVALMGSFNNYGQDKPKKVQFKDIQTNAQQRSSDEIQRKMKIDSKVVTQFTPNSVQAVLYDQTGGTTTQGLPAQDFETAYDAYDCEIADDFTVPAGGWTVRNVIVAGFLPDFGPVESFNVYFYPDDSGVPGATAYYAATAEPYFYNSVTDYFTIVLTTQADLDPGTYWISVQARMDLAAGGQWFWLESTGPIDTEAQFQNPLDGFGSGCTTWGPITGCLGALDTEMSFALTDVQCPVRPLPVVADFEDGMFPPLCWTQSGSIPLWNSSAVLEGFGYPPVSGYGDGSLSAWVDFYSYASGSEDLITLEFDASGATNPTLQFDWAYATYFDDPDELDIYYSTNAGATWTILLAMPGGLTGILNPFNIATTSVYIPANDEWSTMTLPLPAGTNMIKFTGVPAYGNMLFVDNIKIQNLFFDNFEDPPYTFPGQVACQNSEWTTWTLSPCSNDDATISQNYAYSGTQAALIDYTGPRDVDLIKLFNGPPSNSTIPYIIDSLVTGKYYISFRMYIPTGKTGYFNIQSDFTGEQTIGVWGLECYFNAGGAGELTADAIIDFAWQENNWNNCLVVVDLNTGTGEFWFGPNAMSQIYQWDWTRGGTYPNCLNAIDYFGAVLDGDEMYIDDFRFSDVSPPIPQPANEVGTVVINMDYQYAPGIVSPQATVKNYGTNTNTFQVEMTIGSGYSNTQTVTDLAPGASELVTFADWNETTAATYDVNVCTILSGDEDPLNDCKDQNVSIWDPDGDWTAGTDYPITSYNGVGVPYNDGTDNWLFVMGGNTPSGLSTECYKYNVTSDTWTAIADLPLGRLIHAGAVVGDFIYVIGGADPSIIPPANSYTTTTYRYDIGGNSWSTMAAVPTTIGWCRAVGYLDNYIYLAGGYDGVSTPYLSSIYLYDVGTDTWSLTTNPMPNGIFGGAFSVTGNTLVYATGALESGISNVVMVGTINLADPSDIAWTTMKNTYPGNGKEVSGKYGENLVAEMLTQSTGTVNNGHPPLAVNYPAGAIYRNHASTWGSDAIITAGGTPTASYIAADPGPCYVYYPGSDTWIAQENMLVPVGAHQSGSVQDGNTWKFIIASGFGVDSTESETQIYTKTLGGATTFGFTIDVYPDKWNMVSGPGTNSAGMGVGDWWPDYTGTVWSFNGTVYVNETTNPTTPGVGYWMKHGGVNTTYSYTDIGIVPHAAIPGHTGWNIMGVYENNVAESAITTINPAGQRTGTVWGFDGTVYVNMTSGTLETGYGYWIKLLSDCEIVVPDPPLAKGSGEVVEYFKENWGKIILTDAAGISYTLYAVKGEVDLDQYEMPPALPGGMFDIRFSSGRVAEDINSSMKTIDMSGITYPLTVRVEGMDMRLQDVTGNALNVNLKSGEDVVISDATIQKLMVTGEAIPTVYALEQNYPNPFNPSTVIEFSLPEDVSNVKLSIYNALGEKVAEIVNSSLTAGKYQYQWNAKNVATGMYIYELRADKFVSVKKMLLLK